MFVQFIEGKVRDPQALRDRFEQWQVQCADGAEGWIGTTAGVTADGTAFVAARFASAEEARRNSDRPEQSAWWSETEKVFEGGVRFDDCDDVELFRGGGSDGAGFVQVIRGRVKDAAEARDVLLQDLPDDVRPDVIGGFVGMLPDDEYAMVVYFTSEAEARAGEADESDPDLDRQMTDLHETAPRFLDITDPWLSSP